MLGKARSTSLSGYRLVARRMRNIHQNRHRRLLAVREVAALDPGESWPDDGCALASDTCTNTTARATGPTTHSTQSLREAMPLLSSFAAWFRNAQRMATGRPPWTAESEFAYYRVTPELVRQHQERQLDFEQEAFFSGLQLVKALGLLDTSALAGARVLDLGAGECMLAGALAQCGASVWATDAVPKQIWAAAQRRDHRRDMRFVVCDARDLPFADGSFDVVVANLVLHHVEPVDSVLKEAIRVLRPGGRFAALEPTPLIGLLVHEQTSSNEAPIPPATIVKALGSVGFDSPRHDYFWSRGQTSRLGPLSPGYRVFAQKPGSAAERAAGTILRRELAATELSGLELDSQCAFADLVRVQEREIRSALAGE